MNKILIVSTTSSFLKDILKDQPKYLKNDYQVMLVSGDGLSFEDIRKNEDVNILHIPMKRGFSIFYDFYSLIRATFTLLKFRPNIVHSYTPKAGFIFMIASYLCSVPVRVHTFTGLIFPTSEGLKKYVLIISDKLLCYCANTIVAESLGVRNKMCEYHITEKKIEIIGNGNVAGINTSYFSPIKVTESDLIIKNKNNFILCFIGRLSVDKGINDLVDVFIKLPSRFMLLIVGDADKRDPIDNQTLLAIKNHERIFCTGYMPDIRPYLKLSDILVLPSYREGFPNVVLQSLSMKKPVISTDVSGSVEIIKNNINGWIIPKNDIISLENAILNANKLSKSEMNKMGGLGRKLVQEKFERRAYWENLTSFYTERLGVF